MGKVAIPKHISVTTSGFFTFPHLHDQVFSFWITVVHKWVQTIVANYAKNCSITEVLVFYELLVVFFLVNFRVKNLA